jgi:hypothetical protein
MRLGRLLIVLGLAGVGLAIVLAGALKSGPEPRSVPIREILVSDLRGEALVDAFAARLDHLGRDRALMDREFNEAGFRREYFPGRGCWKWTLPVDAGAPDDAVRAFAHLCDTDGEVQPRRVGISRGPMTYD